MLDNLQQEPSNHSLGCALKIAGGMFATIVAPLLVAMVSQRLNPPPPVVAPQPVVVVGTPAPAKSSAVGPQQVATAVPTSTTPPAAPRAAAATTVTPPTAAPPKASSSTRTPAGPANASVSSSSPPTPRKRPLSKAFPKAKFVSLFDGKTLGGWNADGPKHWSVVSGALTGKLTVNAADTRDFLYSKGTYKNFVLTATFKCTKGDVGILFRGKPNSLVAMQVFVGKTKAGNLAVMADDMPRNHDAGFHVIVDDPALAKLFDDDGWNSITIAANDDRIRCEINGHAAFDTQYSKAPRTGVISFKLKPGSQVAFKEIRIARLAD